MHNSVPSTLNSEYVRNCAVGSIFVVVYGIVNSLFLGWMTFAPEWITGSKNLVTDNWLFLWVYLVFFNGLWVIVPLALMYQSWLALTNVTRRPSSGIATKSRSAVEPPSTTSNSGGESSPGNGLRKSGSRRRKQY